MHSNDNNRRTGEPVKLANRFNAGKPKLSRILDAPDALKGFAEVMDAGDAEYGRGNWRKGLPWTEVIDSLLRHAVAFQNNQDLDPKSGKPHTDHMLCNAVFLAQYFREGTGIDDRMEDLKK